MMRFTMQKRFFRTQQIVLLGFPVPLKFAHVSSILLFFFFFFFCRFSDLARLHT